MMLDILIVEDNKEIGTLLCDFLRKENYVVSLAQNGEKALELYETYGAKLIVLDIMLPGVDGFAICSKIREQSNTHILIVGLEILLLLLCNSLYLRGRNGGDYGAFRFRQIHTALFHIRNGQCHKREGVVSGEGYYQDERQPVGCPSVG